MKTKPKIFFHPLEGSAPFSIYWYPGPYGDAIEPKELNGVYFAAPNGELLGVQFDDVDEGNDEQVMTTKSGTKVKVSLKSGKVTVMLDGKEQKVA